VIESSLKREREREREREANTGCQMREKLSGKEAEGSKDSWGA